MAIVLLPFTLIVQGLRLATG